MTLTRTEDKTDKAITRLLMQSPLGLTIGDITAAAKCTPQTARKSLARIKAEKDASGLLYILRDEDEQATPEPQAVQAEPVPAPKPVKQDFFTIRESRGFLNPFTDDSQPDPTDPAPAAAVEPETAPAAHVDDTHVVDIKETQESEPAPAAEPCRDHAGPCIRPATPYEIASALYKPGDKVMILSANPEYAWRQREMVGTVQTVNEVNEHTDSHSICTKIDAFNFWWRLDEIRHATPEEIAAADARLSSKPDPVSSKPAPTPLTDLQQRVLSLLGQHRGLTAMRIAEDLRAPLEGVQDALLALGSRVTSRPLALPEIQVWGMQP